MITAILLTVLPTLLVYILLEKTNLKIKSFYFKIVLSWFVGQYFLTFFVFFLSLLLNLFTSDVLFKSSVLILSLIIISLGFFKKDIIRISKNLLNIEKQKTLLSPVNIFLISFCFLIAYVFYIPHLSYQDNVITRSPVYWDYHWQMSLIQNFVYGDNFPPQNEAFSGIPANYHYLWMVNASIYQSLGLSPVDTINFVSILQFFLLLLIIVGFSMEFFKSKFVGFITILLSVTASGFHFLDYFNRYKGENIYYVLKNILGNKMHPWDVSQNALSTSGYHATMYNLFYFLQERQMIIGVIYLMICAWLINNRKQFSTKSMLLIGALMGGYFMWHLHITIMVLFALCFVLIFDRVRKKTLIMLLGFGFVFLLHYLYFKGITKSEWFLPEINNFPKINFNYSSIDGTIISPVKSLYWYAYSYGLKILLFPLGMYFIFRKDRSKSILVASIILPTFIIINTLQLSPAFIHDNHKFLRPMNVAIDLIVAFSLYTIFFNKKRFYLNIIGSLSIIILTLSGFIQLMPFINSRPTVVFAKYESPLIDAIRVNTQPESVFVAGDEKSIYLSGRKMFLARELRGHDEKVLDKKKRQEIIDDIYDSADKNSFCSLTKKYGIDFMAYGKNKRVLPAYLISSTRFVTTNDLGEEVIFIDTKKSCSL